MKFIRLTISNESGYEQVYHYSLTDSNEWFEPVNEEITISAYQSTDLEIPAIDSNTDITNFTFNIKPIYHSYDSKVYNLDIYKNQMIGDVNGDGGLNVLDVVVLVSMILGNVEPNSNADVNQDGIFNVLDVVTLINLILG